MSVHLEGQILLNKLIIKFNNIDAHSKGCAFIMKKCRFQAVCERVHRYKVGGASLNCINFVVPMNIATTKLIQCGMAEKPENKAFHGFCGCGFLLFWSAATMQGLFCPVILHLFITIAW